MIAETTEWTLKNPQPRHQQQHHHAKPSQHQLDDVTSAAAEKAKEVAVKQSKVNHLKHTAKKDPSVAAKLAQHVKHLAKAQRQLAKAKHAVTVLHRRTGTDGKREEGRFFSRSKDKNNKGTLRSATVKPTSTSSVRKKELNADARELVKDEEHGHTGSGWVGAETKAKKEGGGWLTGVIPKKDGKRAQREGWKTAENDIKSKKDDDGWFAAKIENEEAKKPPTAKEKLQMQLVEMTKAHAKFVHTGCLDMPFMDPSLGDKGLCDTYSAFNCHTKKGTVRHAVPPMSNPDLRKAVGESELSAQQACCRCGGGAHGSQAHKMIDVQENYLMSKAQQHSSVWWKNNPNGSKGKKEKPVASKPVTQALKTVPRTEHSKDLNEPNPTPLSNKKLAKKSIMTEFGKWEVWAFLGLFFACGLVCAASYFFRDTKVFNEYFH